MKTAGSENPNRGGTLSRNRAHGAVGQNKSRSIKWPEKQEKFQPREMCFFLTSPFIELTRPRGLPKYLQVAQDIANCGLDRGLEIDGKNGELRTAAFRLTLLRIGTDQADDRH
ncbi:MAG: hypothetical protein DMG54_00815 [Acidobacteria bacterium]|nr:MAG: hypothetical protein DMG54_00815 [Acidobacteriota bacterium]PYU72368.1 MAG: hypothetical protein DMG52_18790 [Acidobacteriota bacterium]